KWTESVAAASPKVCATADGAQARPGKLSSRCEGVRVFFRDCVQVVRPLLDFPLHALRQFAVFAWFALAAVRPLVGKLVGVKVLGRVEHTTRFQTQHLQPLQSEL